MEKILQLYRMNNEDTVLMKDTNSIYYHYKKQLEAMQRYSKLLPTIVSKNPDIWAVFAVIYIVR